MTEILDKRQTPPPTQGLRHYLPARELEVRQESEGSGPVTFGGYAILWDEETEIRDWLGSFIEVFVKGAFAKTIAERGPEGNGAIKFMLQPGVSMAMI